MHKKTIAWKGIFFIIICISSLLYLQIENKTIDDGFSDGIFQNENEVFDEENSSNTENENSRNTESKPISKALIPGYGKTFAYFPHSNTIQDPENIEYASGGSNVYQWETYDEIKDKGSENAYLDWRADSRDIDPSDPEYEEYNWGNPEPDPYFFAWPEAADTWTLFRDRFNPWQPCKIFSPIFTQEFVLSGRIYFLYFPEIPFSGVTAFSPSTITISYRLRLSLYNSSSSETSDIISHTTTFPATGMTLEQKSVYVDLPEPVVIPQGFRLKLSSEYKFSSMPTTGTIYMRAAAWGGGLEWNWTIDDGIYSNDYYFYEYADQLGIQLYMRDNVFPNIGIYGATNNTIYYEGRTITISSSGATSSWYKWDDDVFTTFSGSTQVSLPTDQNDWRYLTVKSVDEYNNTRINVYRFGFDQSLTNLVINSPINNTNIAEGQLIPYSAYFVDEVNYEWDTNGTIFYVPQVDFPSFEIKAPLSSGYHNLTIQTVDPFGTEIFFYIFYVDNSPPIIELFNVINGGTYGPGKLIEVNISEETDFTYVKYKWDSKDNITWSPTTGTIYGTYLPESIGSHTLYVYTEDIFGHSSNEIYTFTTSATAFLVELKNMRNNSYYYGGNIVEVTISGTNGTIFFKWDNEIYNNGSDYITNSTLILDGSEVLPLDLGDHFLTIRTFDTSEIEHIIIFTFTIDQESPVIDSSINDYNNSRFLDSATFSVILSDNFTQNSDMIVYYSINKGPNQILLNPFEISVSTFYISDGEYNLTLYVYDIAGNYATAFIIFIIDTTEPDIDYTIEDMAIEVIEGNIYIPANATVIIQVSDDDTNIFTMYSWGGSLYHSFEDNFTLNYADGLSILYINASDSLGNENVIQITLIIDSEEPSATCSSGYTKINTNTKIDFTVEDVSEYTVKKIEYRWDLLPPGAWDESFTNEFEIYLYPYYSHNDTAYFSIYVEDIVGNNFTYVFEFIVDIEAPSVNLFDWSQMSLIDISETHYLKGNSTIYVEILDDSDLSIAEYNWGSGSSNFGLNSPWLINLPTMDQTYNLTIILKDDNADTDYPNTRILAYTIVIDDLKIGYISPGDLSNDYHHQMEYGDNFIFTINITDAYDGSEIDTIAYFITKNENINLSIIETQLDNITYQFNIIATNVTNGVETTIIFEFWQFSENKDTIVISLTIDKKEGTLLILEKSDLSVIYGEEVSLILQLRDDLNITPQLISLILINETEIEFAINYGDFSVQINISTSYFTSSKGNYSFEILAESEFYFDIFSNQNVVNIEIKPIPVILFLSVSNYTIIEGTQLAIYASITYFNGTPIPLITLKIYIYIVFKNESKGVTAQIATYDDLEILTGITNSTGFITIPFEMTTDIQYLYIEGEFEGNQILDFSKFSLEDYIYSTPFEGLPKNILYIIIASSIVLICIIGFIIYKITRRKPFEVIFEEISEEEINNNFDIMSAGIIFSIFDQSKGPIPLLSNHSFEHSNYKRRIGDKVDNLLLKVCDQAYTSLGFEDHDDTRKTGSITLIKEKMIGFTHGIQLENPNTRGGFENLTVIVLTDFEYKNLLLSYQSYLYQEIDDLKQALKEKKNIEEIRILLKNIREKAVKIMLAAQKIEK